MLDVARLVEKEARERTDRLEAGTARLLHRGNAGGAVNIMERATMLP